jgi:hypothetical protein
VVFIAQVVVLLALLQLVALWVVVALVIDFKQVQVLLF